MVAVPGLSKNDAYKRGPGGLVKSRPLNSGGPSAVRPGWPGPLRGHKVHKSVKFCIMAGTAMPRIIAPLAAPPPPPFPPPPYPPPHTRHPPPNPTTLPTTPPPHHPLHTNAAPPPPHTHTPHT